MRFEQAMFVAILFVVIVNFGVSQLDTTYGITERVKDTNYVEIYERKPDTIFIETIKYISTNEGIPQ